MDEEDPAVTTSSSAFPSLFSGTNLPMLIYLDSEPVVALAYFLKLVLTSSKLSGLDGRTLIRSNSLSGTLEDRRIFTKNKKFCDQ